MRQAQFQVEPCLSRSRPPVQPRGNSCSGSRIDVRNESSSVACGSAFRAFEGE